jgi:hypothetical protein
MSIHEWVTRTLLQVKRPWGRDMAFHMSPQSLRLIGEGDHGSRYLAEMWSAGAPYTVPTAGRDTGARLHGVPVFTSDRIAPGVVIFERELAMPGRWDIHAAAFFPELVPVAKEFEHG